MSPSTPVPPAPPRTRAEVDALPISPPQAMQRALAAYERGAWGEAELLCRRILDATPDYFDALNLLGIIAAQTQRTREAAELLGRAVAVNPTNAAAHNNHGITLQELRRLDEALAAYDRALQIRSDYAEAHYNRGNALKELGRLGEALDSYERAIRLKPDFAGAYNNRGVTLHGLRRPVEALDSYDHALKIKPDYAEAHNNRGNALKDLKRLDEALESYDRALRIDPNNAESYLNRGVALQEQRRLGEALDSFDRALGIRRGYAEALGNRGSVLKELGRPDEALDSCDQAIALKPDFAEAHNNRGNALQELRRLDEALAAYDRALLINPDDAEACYNRGSALQELGRLTEAVDSFDRALTIRPDYAEACSNRGNALKELGRLDEALDSYARALRIRPDSADAHFNRGNALKDLKRLDEALDSFDRALRIRPDSADVFYNRGNTLRELARLDEALDSFDRALSIRPDHAEARNNRGDLLIRLNRPGDAVQCYTQLLELAPAFSFAKGNLLHAKMLSCEWSGLDGLNDSIRQDIIDRKQSATPFGYQAISESEQDLRACAEIYAAERFPPKPVQVRATRAERHARVRIGYLSGEFRNQATSVLMAELFELHAKDRFELFAFDNGWDDGSEIRARINRSFDEIVDIRRAPDLEAASLINRRGIDILVSLNGYFGEGRQGIFSCRPSPIQVNYLGFPGTLGAGYMDYLIADGTLIPDASRQHYSEKIAYLPDCYQPNDRRRAIADRTFLRDELGLPRDGFVFCCFNNNYKITPRTFDGWMRILRRVGGSVLWLLEDNPAAARNLRNEAGARGVSPERLIFAKRMPLGEHLARHRAANLFIDTLPYNAHTTASDALWAGLPLLTRIGQTFPGRVAASLLKAIGLPELITTSEEQYEALAVDLATDSQRLEQIRKKLWRNRLTTPLFDTRLFAGHIEDAYMQMYERYQAGLPPVHIHVSR